MRRRLVQRRRGREADGGRKGASTPLFIRVAHEREGMLRMGGQGHAGEKWTDCLGWHQDEVTIGDDGWADFKCPVRPSPHPRARRRRLTRRRRLIRSRSGQRPTPEAATSSRNEARTQPAQIDAKTTDTRKLCKAGVL